MSGVIINQHTNIGFYKATVSKSLLLFIGGGHAATHLPALEPFFRRIFAVQRLDNVASLLRVLMSKLIFPDTRTAVIACFLIYFFRTFERRYGSLKFSSNIISTFLISFSLELICEHFLELRSFGPMGLIMPLFVPCYLQIPVISASQFGPISISSKSFYYLLGLQVALTTKQSIASTICSLVAGVIVYCTSVKKVMLPGWLGKLMGSTWGRIIATAKQESSGLLGATLEIQRSQQTEAIEQQLLRARNRYNAPVGGRQMRLDEMWGGGAAARGAAVVPSPVLLQTLTDMGFPRDRVEQVLRQTNNDLDMATNLLLQEM